MKALFGHVDPYAASLSLASHFVQEKDYQAVAFFRRWTRWRESLPEVILSQDQVKKLKKGEVLFRENDATSNVYVLQSGKLSLFVERGGKKVEVGSVGPMQVIGEQAVISSTGKHTYGAEAMQETKLAEIPVEILKAMYEKFPAGYKLFVRGLLEEAKQSRVAMRNMKMESDKSPMPQMMIPRVFALLHLLPRHIGKKDANDPNKVTVSWQTFKQYANRFFGESPVRLRHLMDLLLKLKFAVFTVRVTEDEEEELADLTISNLQGLEDFAEFYSYHLLKGTRAEAIYVDPLALKVAKALVEFSEGAPVDHKGASQVDYNEVLTKFKAKFRQDLNNTHLDSMEKKGLFVQRKSIVADGPLMLLFDRGEFMKLSSFWSIINEIDKWNERGMILLNEKEEVVAIGNGCPDCNAPISKEHKFCPSCGFKLAA